MRRLCLSLLALCVVLAGAAFQPDLANAATPKISVRVSPSQGASGTKSVTLTATVKHGKAGQRAVVDRRPSSKSAWVTVASLPLPSTLTVKVKVAPKLAKNYYRVRVERKGSTKAAKSPSVVVTGLVKLTPARPKVGQAAVYSGELPTSFKRSVKLQKRVAGKWRTIKTTKSGGHGKARFTLKLKTTTTVRIYAPKVRYKKKLRAAFASPKLTVDPILPPNTKVDSDKDKLPDYVEQRLGTSRTTLDTDGDGLRDEQEVVLSTNPLKKDSDGNGVLDPADDLDHDGVTNRRELADGTKAYEPDTDRDQLTDGDEKTRGTNPLKADTDGDGVSDAVEVTLGTNPRSSDSDGDGKPDAKESYSRDVSTVGGATFEATGTPKAVATASLDQVPASTFAGMTGSLGVGVEVTSEAKLDSGTLTIPFDARGLPSGARIGVLHFNESTGTFDLPADQQVDIAAGTATVTTSSFSPFIVVNLDEFEAIWKREIVEPREGNSHTQNIDAVLALDSSGSMADNDPNGDRKVAAKSFVDALIPNDRASALDFDDMVEQLQHLTTDFAAVKALIDSVDDSGGTDIGAAVGGGLDELDQNGDSTHGRVMVLLTDGQGEYDSALTSRAADSKTTIYTVGLGSSVDETLLQSIADGTGGKYFQVANSGQLPDAFDRIIGDIGAPDTDGDGLSDEAETTGWRTQRGAVYKTDPTKDDSDGDGLSDGDEAGPLTKGAFGTAFDTRSNPTVIDSDGDNLDDMSETTLGTDAFQQDTDHDELTDKVEVDFGSDPLTVNADGDLYLDADEYRLGLDPLSYDLQDIEKYGALLGGFIFGDWTDGAKNVGLMTDAQLQSVDYIIGQFASGVIVIGDIRDLAVHIHERDFWKSVLAGAAFLPIVGDVGKVSKQVIKFSKLGPIAAKNAFRVIDQFPLSLTKKKALLGAVFGSGVKVFPKALEGGTATTFLYYGIKIPNTKIYVGITNDIARRTSQHGARFDVQKIQVSALTRGQARAVEEALIVRACGTDVRNCTKLVNKIHSISPSHPFYPEAKAWADDFIKIHHL